MKKFGKYIKKAQTGMEANAGVGDKNNQNKQINWGQIGTMLTPLATQFANQQAQKANVYNSNNPYYNQAMQSAYALDVQNQQRNNAQKGQMLSNIASTGLNLAVPGLGLAVPVADGIVNTIAKPEQKYGINYYDKDWKATASNLAPSRMLNNAFSFDEDETDLEKGVDLATLGLYSAFFKSKDRNEKNKNKIKELENAEKQLETRNRYLTQGIYAKKGVSFGKYKIQQVKGVPRHKDNKVYDSIENKEYPAVEKGAGGVVIPFGKGIEKKKVLIENGEYVVKDEDNEIIAVLPKKIGEKVINKKITLEEAFNQVPDVNEAETAKVMQDGGVDEQVQEEEQQETQPMMLPDNNTPDFLTIKKLIYSDNPVLNAILNKDAQRKLIAKKGLVNEDGYLHSSENKNNPVNIIKSNIITTEGMAFPIYANGKLLKPNTGLYKFASKYVIETPAFNKGGKCGFGKYTKKAQKGIEETEETQDTKTNPFMWRTQNITTFGDINKKFRPITNETGATFENKITNVGNIYNKFNPNTNKQTNTEIDWHDPDIAKDNASFMWSDPDIARENELNKKRQIDWYDPDIAKENAKKPKTTNDIIKKNPFNFSSTNEFKAIDPNTAFSYGLGLFQLWKAYNAKPSQRGAYTMSPEIKRVLGQRKYYEKYGDQKAYKDALTNIERERMRAMRALNTNTSAGSYLNTVSSMSSNLSNAQNEAMDKFITQQQKIGRDNTANWIQTVYQPALDKEFSDSVNRYKEHQEFLNNREKAIMGSLKYMNDILQNRKTNAIQQYNEYFKQMDAYNRNLLEYKLLYGTDKEKEEAKYLLENPHLLYTRATPKYFGFYQPYKQPFNKKAN